MNVMTFVAIVAVLLHLLVCLILWLLIRFDVLEVKGTFLPFMLLVPVWGPLCTVLLHTRNTVLGKRLATPTLERMRVEDQERRSVLVEDRGTIADTVPLEEALIVDTPQQKRSLMLSILNENPSRYISLLQQARLNEDAEVVHYAATAMAQISTKEDMRLRQLERAYEANPASDTALDEYCDCVGEYLASGLVQGHARQMQRQKYAELLALRLQRHFDSDVARTLARVRIDLGDDDGAQSVIDMLLARDPESGDAWLLRLSLEASRQDGAAVAAVVDEIRRRHVYLGAEGRQTLRFWTDDGAGEAA